MTKIVPPRLAEPSQTPIIQGPVRSARQFGDYQYWHSISRYRLPKHKTPLSVGAMAEWRKRLGLWPAPTKDQEFVDMNPTWPLAAWVGLLLEDLKA